MSTNLSPAYSAPPLTIAVFGAGRVGTALARTLLRAGYQVRVVGSGPPQDIALIVDVLAPGAEAMEGADAVAGADIVILAVPLHKIDSIDSTLLDSKVVVDVMNYWEPIDGTLTDFEGGHGTTSVIQSKFSDAHVVKAFNHIGYHDIETDGRAPGHESRRALAVSGDQPQAVELVLDMVHRTGFDAVYSGDLSRSAILEAGGPIFGVKLARREMERHLAPRLH